MCRNHSHLSARFAGEDTSGQVPVLMYLLANDELTIEGPGPDGGKLILKSSGKLFVPSPVLAGFSPPLPPAMVVPRMSLYLLPDLGKIIMQPQRWDSNGVALPSETQLIDLAFSPLLRTGMLTEEEISPF